MAKKKKNNPRDKRIKNIQDLLEDAKGNKYASDIFLEKILFPSIKTIRLLRLVNYIAIHQDTDQGAVHKDIRLQYSKEQHNIDPEKTEQEVIEKDEHGVKIKRYILNDHRNDIERLKEIGLIEIDGLKSKGRKSPRYMLTGEGRKLSKVRIDKKPLELLNIIHYLKALDNAMPFEVMEDWKDLFDEEESKSVKNALKLYEDMTPSILFDSNRNVMRVLGGRYQSSDVYDKVVRHIGRLFWSGISGRIVNGEREWKKFNVTYRGTLNGKVDVYKNVIPAFLKQYNRNWYLIALTDPDNGEFRTFALERIIKLEATENYIRPQFSQTIKELRGYWKDKAGLFGIGEKISFEFKLKNGSRHKNNEYFITQLFHEGITIPERVYRNDDNNNVSNEAVVYFCHKEIYYGPEIWRELRKWGAHNFSAVWPKKLYLDLNEDRVVTFGTNDLDLFKDDKYGAPKYEKLFNEYAVLFEPFISLDLSKYIDDISGLEKVVLDLINADRVMQDLLLKTENAELIFDVEGQLTKTSSKKKKDLLYFWGAEYRRDKSVGSAQWHGKNMLGKILVIVRERLRINRDIQEKR